MGDVSSFTLENLQQKHPHLSQLNNWTSKKLAEGFFDSSLQQESNVPVNHDNNAKTQSVLRPLKGNKVSPLSPIELGRVSQLPPVKSQTAKDRINTLSVVKGLSFASPLPEIAKTSIKDKEQVDNDFDTPRNDASLLENDETVSIVES